MGLPRNFLFPRAEKIPFDFLRVAFWISPRGSSRAQRVLVAGAGHTVLMLGTGMGNRDGSSSSQGARGQTQPAIAAWFPASQVVGLLFLAGQALSGLANIKFLHSLCSQFASLFHVPHLVLSSKQSVQPPTSLWISVRGKKLRACSPTSTVRAELRDVFSLIDSILITLTAN